MSEAQLQLRKLVVTPTVAVTFSCLILLKKVSSACMQGIQLVGSVHHQCVTTVTKPVCGA